VLKSIFLKINWNRGFPGNTCCNWFLGKPLSALWTFVVHNEGESKTRKWQAKAC